jgi:peptidoglycan/xylan/chitin deacetylase (PgdA/CDA1 family)
VKRGRLLLTFDYELKTGADTAYERKLDWGMRDYHKTNKLLKILEEFDAKATFYCLGVTAKKGGLPYSSRSQLKKIVRGGHEIGAHTMSHSKLSYMDRDDLFRDIVENKKILEEVAGKGDVTSFAPPFNLPSVWWGKGAFSLAEKGVKNTIPDLTMLLHKAGYKTFRVLYVTLWERLSGKPLAYDAVMSNGIKCLRMSCRGFDFKIAHEAMHEASSNDKTAMIYDHAHCLQEDKFIAFLEEAKRLKVDIIRAMDVR